ncbi:hypothetical protein HTIA_p2811 (plasmid) [Halorhabdus tiamatea SARL4B]|uniref:Uncharacterized protein n=1 Tax=Halorhabdus tiamatea SARL4B TaxID=1033806 RepID=S6D2D7_9EURY|nr:hypothetical protein HTIA_p2811 [Halorhabdus tiamatea SARL4B]
MSSAQSGKNWDGENMNELRQRKLMMTPFVGLDSKMGST